MAQDLIALSRNLLALLLGPLALAGLLFAAGAFGFALGVAAAWLAARPPRRHWGLTPPGGGGAP